MSLLNSSWSVSKVSFLCLSYWTLRSFWKFIISSLQYSTPTGPSLLFPSCSLWLLPTSPLLALSHLPAFSFFSCSLPDNIIHSLFLNTIISVSNTLFLPVFFFSPITEKVGYLIGQVRNWGIILPPLLSLILHIASISKCHLFYLPNTSWSAHSLHLHLHLPREKGSLISCTGYFRRLLTVLQLSAPIPFLQTTGSEFFQFQAIEGPDGQGNDKDNLWLNSPYFPPLFEKACTVCALLPRPASF